MQFRPDTYNKLAGKRFLGAFAPRCAEVQVIINGFVECFDYLGDGLPLESDNITEADDTSKDDFRLTVKLREPGVPSVFHLNLI